MFSDVEQQVIYRIANSPIREYPYPHIYVESVFPETFYKKMRELWPSTEDLTSIAETGRTQGYKERFILPLKLKKMNALPPDSAAFWKSMGEWLLGMNFLRALATKFQPYINVQFGNNINLKLGSEALIVRDFSNYAIGPHTDVPSRLLSLLFYCPDHLDNSHLGTSIYIPREPGVECITGQHYSFSKFHRVATMPFQPNSLFAFLRTDSSFHGVEPITEEGIQRDLLLYDIRILQEASMPVKNTNRIEKFLGKVMRGS